MPVSAAWNCAFFSERKEWREDSCCCCCFFLAFPPSNSHELYCHELKTFFIIQEGTSYSKTHKKETIISAQFQLCFLILNKQECEKNMCPFYKRSQDYHGKGFFRLFNLRTPSTLCQRTEDWGRDTQRPSTTYYYCQLGTTSSVILFREYFPRVV